MPDEELEKIKKKQLEEMLKNQKESKIRQEISDLDYKRNKAKKHQGKNCYQRRNGIQQIRDFLGLEGPRGESNSCPGIHNPLCYHCTTKATDILPLFLLIILTYKEKLFV